MLLGGYWAAILAVSNDPDSGWSQLLSLFPATAPFAMPGRIALGAAAWWEPLLAARLTLAAIAGLVVFAGRVYTNAILHTGPTLTLRDAWRGTTTPSGTPHAGAPPHQASDTQVPRVDPHPPSLTGRSRCVRRRLPSIARR